MTPYNCIQHTIAEVFVVIPNFHF